MEELKSRILFGIDYRPCLITIPQKMKLNNKREPEVEEKEKHIMALFHCWSHKAELVGESPVVGGHPAGQISGTVGIVEYEDGSIHEVVPCQIRFVDNEIRNYGFYETENI